MSKKEPKDSTMTTASKEATQCETRTSGTIYSSRIEALRIIAGTTFPGDAPTFVRFCPGSADDEITFNVGIEKDTINFYNGGKDACMNGVFNELFDQQDQGVNHVQRVTFQIPYDARKAFQRLKNEQSSFQSEFTSGTVSRWNCTKENLDFILTQTFNAGFNVVTTLSVLRELYDPHPEHTVGDTNEVIITDNAHIDAHNSDDKDEPLNYEHDHGGNPHDVTYFLENGECPASDCNAEFDVFRSLKGHVAAKCKLNDEDGEKHRAISLRRHEMTVAREQPNPTAAPELSRKEHSRLKDIVETQPTCNSRLKREWGFSKSAQVPTYIENHLSNYCYRDEDSYIRATEEVAKIF